MMEVPSQIVVAEDNEGCIVILNREHKRILLAGNIVAP